MKMPTLEQFRSSRNVLFWSLHAAGWAAYGLTQYFGALFYDKPSSYARVIAVSAVAGFVLSTPMRFIYRRLWEPSVTHPHRRSARHLLYHRAGTAHRHQSLL